MEYLITPTMEQVVAQYQVEILTTAIITKVMVEILIPIMGALVKFQEEIIRTIILIIIKTHLQVPVA